MKLKNYPSAIHNFAHSFKSEDYTKSGKLAVNVLIRLNKLKRIPSATFDFVTKTIESEEAITTESKQLLNDYLSWLPEHLKHHQCDITQLEKLQLTISADFDKAFTPYGFKDSKELTVRTKVVWKLLDRAEQDLDIVESAIYANEVLTRTISNARIK